MMSASSPFISLNDSLKEVIKDSSLKTTGNTPLFSHFLKWNEIGDERTKNHTDGVFYLDEGGIRTLIVYVDSSTWAQEFTLDKSLLLARVEVMFGDTWIDNIKFVVSKHVSENKKTHHENLRYEQVFSCDTSHIKLSEDEIYEAEILTKSIDDESLKQAIKKAYLASKKWEKAGRSL